MSEAIFWITWYHGSQLSVRTDCKEAPWCPIRFRLWDPGQVVSLYGAVDADVNTSLFSGQSLFNENL